MSGLFWFVHTVIALVFTIGLYFLWFRLTMHFVQFNSPSPIVKFVTHWTDYVIKPLSPLFGNMSQGRVEWPALVVTVVVEALKFYLLAWMVYGFGAKLGVVLLVIVGDCLIFPLQLLFYAFILRILIGWFPGIGGYSLKEVVYAMTDPLVQYSRDWISPVSGYDFLPLAWILILKALSFFIYVSMPLHVG